MTRVPCTRLSSNDWLTCWLFESLLWCPADSVHRGMKVRAEHAAEECMHLNVVIIDIVGLLIVWPGYCSAAEAWAPCCKEADNIQDNTAAKLYCQLQTAVALSQLYSIASWHHHPQLLNTTWNWCIWWELCSLIEAIISKAMQIKLLLKRVNFFTSAMTSLTLSCSRLLTMNQRLC